MPLFRRQPTKTEQPAATGVHAATFRGRERKVEIVGEASYQDTISRLAGGKSENGANLYKVAELVPDLKNRFDPNAVAAKIDGLTVGYLSKEQALGYHRAMAAFGSASLVGCRARIHGGWKRLNDEGEVDEGYFGVTFLLPQSIAQEIGFS